MFRKEIRQIFHGIRPETRNVAEMARFLQPQRFYLVANIVGHLDPDLHAEHEGFRIQGGQGD